MNIGKKLGMGAAILCGLALIGLIIFRVMFVSYIDNTEMGFQFDKRTGVLSKIKTTGYYVHAPIVVAVNTIDLKPVQVCINANSRVSNCKLVEFDTTGWRMFVNMHGRRDYENGTIGGEVIKGSLSDILLSYAYDGSNTKYPFLKIKSELKAIGQSVPPPAVLPTKIDTIADTTKQK